MIDVRRFDRVNLLFYGRDLCCCLFEGMFVLLLPSKCCFGRYIDPSFSTLHSLPSRIYQLPLQWMLVHRSILRERSWDLPVLFTVTFFRASASCSAIWFSRCLSLFCNISSCCRRPKIASFGASLRFWAPLPPNQPHIMK